MSYFRQHAELRNNVAKHYKTLWLSFSYESPRQTVPPRVLTDNSSRQLKSCLFYFFHFYFNFSSFYFMSFGFVIFNSFFYCVVLANVAFCGLGNAYYPLLCLLFKRHHHPHRLRCHSPSLCQFHPVCPLLTNNVCVCRRSQASKASQSVLRWLA